MKINIFLIITLFLMLVKKKKLTLQLGLEKTIGTYCQYYIYNMMRISISHIIDKI